MSPAKLKRFADAERYFICPLCREELRLSGTSLRCTNRHTFDIAKQGYVNLVPAAKQSQYYSKESFENRRTVLEGGYYQHVLDAVLDAVARYCAKGTILDAGCGEGFYARAAQQANPAATMLAFDIAKDSVQLAARDDASMAVKWFVGNLAQLPLADGVVDCVLDVFSPANYEEFARVLAPRGIIVKVVPGANHDAQLRELAREQLRHGEYANDSVVEQFAEHADVLENRTVSRTFAMPPEDMRAFAHMTPLLFNVDIEQLDLSRVGELTVEAQMLVGRIRKD